MNERDKELAMQAGFNPFDTECYEGLDGLIDLIRADEREAIFNMAQKIAARFYKDATEEAFDELTDAILLRGKT